MEKYQRLHQIGQGSFGAVYLVRQVDTGEKLVVKQVNTAKITQSEQQKVIYSSSFLDKNVPFHISYIIYEI